MILAHRDPLGQQSCCMPASSPVEAFVVFAQHWDCEQCLWGCITASVLVVAFWKLLRKLLEAPLRDTEAVVKPHRCRSHEAELLQFPLLRQHRLGPSTQEFL